MTDLEKKQIKKLKGFRLAFRIITWILLTYVLAVAILNLIPGIDLLEIRILLVVEIVCVGLLIVLLIVDRILKVKYRNLIVRVVDEKVKEVEGNE
jgi:hypothetical protein